MIQRVLPPLCLGVVLGWCIATFTKTRNGEAVSAGDGEALSGERVEDSSVSDELGSSSLPAASHVSSRHPQPAIESHARDSTPGESADASIKSPWEGVFSMSLGIPTAEDLERRFGGLDMQALKGAEAGIAWGMVRELRALADEKYELGIYEAFPVVNGRGPLQTGSTDGSFKASKTWHVRQPDGRMEARVVEVLGSESPFLAARYVETNWLVARQAALSKE